MAKGQPKELTISQKNAAVRGMLLKMKGEIAMALPRHLNPDRMARIALTEVRKSPKLLDCTQESLAGAVIQAAQLGLEPGSGLGHCYLIPYGKECQLQMGYLGLLELARRSGQIASIDCDVVYEDDEFVYNKGDDAKVVHKPKFPRAEKPNFENIIAAYAIAKFKDGGIERVVMERWDIERAKNKSKTAKYSDSPWKEFYDLMCIKTVLKRLAKRLPKSPELIQAMKLDTQNEIGEKQEYSHLFDSQEEQAQEDDSIPAEFRELGNDEQQTLMGDEQ